MKMTQLRQTPDDQFTALNAGLQKISIFTSTNFPPAGPFSSIAQLHDCMSDMFEWPAKMRQLDLDPTNILDSYREMLPDDSPIRFTHAELDPINIMVSKDSPCCIMVILDWEQSGWYLAYWEFCKAELTTEIDSEWQATYLPKMLVKNIASIFTALQIVRHAVGSGFHGYTTEIKRNYNFKSTKRKYLVLALDQIDDSYLGHLKQVARSLPGAGTAPDPLDPFSVSIVS
ncbi:phosphotransferase family [Fusarium heterosporum]|uniref:Phosphotransferase family n=1 Tax=Fusarium heterosporum TaxID=42747 RepID=A0A8H5SSJ0_FUSHE|nr:phosphotransferase family [Fusarium heterosporum]